MAFRIHDSVVRGEIDNRTKGIVRGRIWLEGRSEPVVLELRGNAHPDLAGSLLTFTNPDKRYVDSRVGSLTPEQRGVAGDLTASRKARVFDLPSEQGNQKSKAKLKAGEQLANSLYLEWFSETNGRIVIESSNYELNVSAPEWQLTADENAQRAREAEAAMKRFVQQLTEGIAQHQRGQKHYEEQWNEHDYERFLREADARAEKYGELLDKYGEKPEAEEKIAEQMGWRRELGDEEPEERERWIEEMNRACEEALNEPEPEPPSHREGIDWIRDKHGRLHHPLQQRAFESAIKFWHETKALGLQECSDKDLADFLSEFQITSVKLGGALDRIARGERSDDPAFTIACLKRALDHLHKAQAALEAVARKSVLPNKVVADARQELFAVREGILQIMDELRGPT